MVPEDSEPLLLVRVEAFQRRGSTKRMYSVENLTSDVDVLCVDELIHVDAMRVAETTV